MNARDKIVQGLITLMKTKDIEDISIKELTGVAGVNRSTYYYYFYEISDVIKYIMDMFLEKVESIVIHDQDSIVAGENYVIDKTIAAYDFIIQNKELFSAIVRSKYKHTFYEKIADVMVNVNGRYVHYYEKDGNLVKMSNKERRYWDTQAAYSWVGALECWVRSGYEESSDELIQLTYKLVSQEKPVYFRKE